MHRLLFRGVLILSICSLAACNKGEPVTAKRGPESTVTRSAKPAFDTHWTTETQFIVESTLIDLAGMAYYAKNGRAIEPNILQVAAQEIPGQGGKPLSYQVRIQFGPTLEITTPLVVAGSIWSPEMYRSITEQFLEKLLIDRSKQLPSDKEERFSYLEDLTSPTPGTIERQNSVISGELQKHFLSAARHEHAALLLAAFSLREQSGMFYEIRSELCRIAAHLAFAEVLRRGKSVTPEGQLATAALAALYEDQRSALKLLDAVPAGERWTEAWVRALRIRITGDYRLIAGVKDPTLLERREEFAARIIGIEAPVAERALDEHDELRGLCDWSRLLNSHHPSVELGHQILDHSITSEVNETLEVYHLAKGENLDKATIVDALNVEPEPCITRATTDTTVVRVIGWGHWAGFLQRHLCHAVQSDFNFLQRSWGVPEEAKSYRAAVDQQFGGLRLYPFVRRQNSTEEAYYREAQDSAMTVVRHRPHLVPAAVWNEISYKVPFAVLYIPPPHPFVNEWHRYNPLPGTAYNFYPRSYQPSLTKRSDITALLSQLHEMAPYNNFVTHYYLFKRGDRAHPDSSDGPAMEEGYAEVLAFNSNLAGAVAEAYKAQPDQFEKWTIRAALIDPYWNYALGKFYADAGREAEAARAYEQIVLHDTDAVRMSHRCRWLVQYYERTGAPQKALALAKTAAEVYSSGGLEIMAELLEKRGDYPAAIKYHQKLSQRYGNTASLVACLLRFQRAAGKADLAPALRNIMTKTLPRGLELIDGAKLKGPPKRGVVLEEETSETKKSGLRLTDVIVGVRGYETDTFNAYQAIRDMELDTPFKLLVWREGSYQEISAAPPDNRFGAQMRDYSAE